MRIGIVCYASVGGSGVVATELGHALAQRGHQVHLISSEVPFRWREGFTGLTFERVDTPSYPLFREPQYLLALANTIVRVACARRLEILHAHYAIPHATAAYLAHQIIQSDAALSPMRTVTTLHGTDITLVGSDPSYRRVVAFSIEQSHGVTAVSESLKRDTIASLGVTRDIAVIPNFLDCDEYRREANGELRPRLAPSGEAIILHVSNFRPVKRVDVVFEVFRRVRERVPARLVLIGDGPERATLERRVSDSGLSSDVLFAGEQQDLVSWLSAADVLLLPSEQESFGLAALEAMACEVPVVASRVGGLPEVISEGRTGFLCDLDDLSGMAERVITVVRDRELGRRIGQAAAADVRARYCVDRVVPMYEKYYEDVLRART
jgi:N-acetyl-alpha-D-glucosaminyl L-malate synthase BshA